MDKLISESPVKPFSLKDAPSLIERVWPAQKISVEAQKERKAVKGQTLTGLGSYWKGRKPLILVRACIFGALLPSTGDDIEDIKVFEALCGLADNQVRPRFKSTLSVAEITTYATPEQRSLLLGETPEDQEKYAALNRDERADVISDVIARMPYHLRVGKLLRPEEVAEDTLTSDALPKVNDYLGTNAENLAQLIEQLGIMRFGRRPRVADVFCGGGSIPFEAARLGCDVYASDLNPVACMLTWGSLNVIGASAKRWKEIEVAEKALVAAIDKEIAELGIEHDSLGNRAKAFLYCLETRCPQTGWMVPLSPSWVISRSKEIIAVLIPDPDQKRYKIEVRAAKDVTEFAAAQKGTIQAGRLVHVVDGQEFSTPVKTLRGDRKGHGETITDIRAWEKDEFSPRVDDLFQERLYAIQWITKESLSKKRQTTFFTAVRQEDEEREKKVVAYVKEHLSDWQGQGFVPDMEIEPGKETARLTRERGWTYWHHAFTPRDYIILASLLKHNQEAEIGVLIPSLLNHASKLCQWATTNAPLDADGNQAGGARDLPNHVFYNQAFNTFWNYASRASIFLLRDIVVTKEVPRAKIAGKGKVVNASALDLSENSDIFITDPPYADAVYYHEISEFFIAWLRKRPPKPFKSWTWDSRRPLAIKGDGEDFRKGMVDAYKAMADHMPDNGLQIVMFTHQDARVWGDMAQIFWGAGLRVMAAWYIATETTSELKKGGYVQGTVILVLRKRKDGEDGFKDEVVQEVRYEVAEQIDTMVGLNQSLKGHGRVENLFEDADLQMAGYAAALRVLTKYTKIDGVDMTKEALRPRKKGEKGIVSEIIEFAVQVANEHMVPEGMPPKVWESLSGAERFFFKMMDIETTGAKKLDNYQNFGKAFRVAKYDDLMGSMAPNDARLKSAKEFKKAGFEGSEFGASKSRALLYAIYELQNDIEGDDVLSHLRDLVSDYFNAREELMALAQYVATKRAGKDDAESRAAGILHGLIRNERFG
jgi:putative DNA methylase